MIERRQNNASIRTTDKGWVGLAAPVYDGTAATEYELWDGTVERFAPESFSEHLATNPDVFALFNHDMNHVLGRTKANTLEVRSTKDGVKFTITPPQTTLAKDLAVSIDRGDVTQTSFAFTPQLVDWIDEEGRTIRLIRSAKLYDVSVVTVGAYSGGYVGLRGEERKKLEQERDEYREKVETEKRLTRILTLTSQAEAKLMSHADRNIKRTK